MDINKLYEPINYTMRVDGKNIRKHIILYLQSLLGNIDNPLTDIIINDINVSHNASLIIDDIHDESIKRRGKLCAYLLFGKPLTLNAGYLKSLSILNSVDKKYPKKYANKIKDLSVILFIKDILDKVRYILDKTNIYLLLKNILMIDNKTGIMFNTCAKTCIYTSSNKCKSAKQKLLILLMTFIGRFFKLETIVLILHVKVLN